MAAGCLCGWLDARSLVQGPVPANSDDSDLRASPQSSPVPRAASVRTRGCGAWLSLLISHLLRASAVPDRTEQPVAGTSKTQGVLGAERAVGCPREIHGLLSPCLALAHGSGCLHPKAWSWGNEGQKEVDTAVSQPQTKPLQAEAYLRSHGLLEPRGPKGSWWPIRCQPSAKDQHQLSVHWLHFRHSRRGHSRGMAATTQHGRWS
ncbi:hypothetical protein P7K49_026043 [Saguinus oedipus]|uniref:Uncharacterized protein n=1 Tax=Saguinus oedipus TaxID=9490 RepID=A0ABQ9UIV9_SAGOE|nr:hypothetical protein P7K49_026043 [Saguinus oedipus]